MRQDFAKGKINEEVQWPVSRERLVSSDQNGYEKYKEPVCC